MSEWKEEVLVDCLESLIDYRGKTPQKSNDGILTLSAKSVKMGKIDYSQAYHISAIEYKKFMVRGFPKKGDILMTTEAPLGCIAKLDRDGVSVAQRLLVLRGKKGVLDNDYLMYYLMSRRGQYELQSRASGSTVQGIKRSEFEHVLIPLPELIEQEEIAKTLSCLDQKITLLRQQNHDLEDLAQTLFKHWFVEFEFPNENGEPYKSSGGKMVASELGEIPEGWRVGTLGDILEIKYGKDHKHLENGKYPLYGSGGIMRYVEKALYNKPSILIPRKGTLTNIFYLEQPFWSVDTMFFSKIKMTNHGKYCYQWLKRIKFSQLDVGSAIPSLTTKLLNEMEILIPDEIVAKRFEKVLSSIFNNMNLNVDEIQTLSQLRDTLLPKLMSGELKVAREEKDVAVD